MTSEEKAIAFAEFFDMKYHHSFDENYFFTNEASEHIIVFRTATVNKMYATYICAKQMIAANSPFICGMSPSFDLADNQMPEAIQVCRAFGSDWVEIYKKVERKLNGS